ncbi:MAG: diguanylate cyclase [Acidimicrobiia bacterium]
MTKIPVRSAMRVRNFAIICVLAFALSAVGLGFRHGPTISVVWPAATIIIGILIRMPQMARWEAFVASAGGFYLADGLTHNHSGHGFVAAVANTVFVVVGWYLLYRSKPVDLRLGRAQSVVVIYFVSVVAALVSGASAMVLEQLLGADTSATTVLSWAIVSFSNAALVLPVVLTAPAWRRVRVITNTPRQEARGRVIVTPVFLVAMLSFGIYIYAPTAVTFAVPVLIFSALRSGVFNTAVLAVFTLALMLGAIVFEVGDFVAGSDMDTQDVIVVMQLSLAFMAMGPIAVASTTAMRNQELFLALRQAELDGLTGAYTRRAFFEKAALLLELAEDSGRPVTVAMIDFDNFKKINDRYGHAVGDLVIQDVVSVIKEHMRDTDLLGRLGGDEFAIVRSGINCDFVQHLAEGIRAQVARLGTLASQSLLPATSPELIDSLPAEINQISISIGVVCQEKVTRSVNDLLELADKALYQAKQAKNVVVVHKVS